jgi:hypothetical protein
VDARAGQVSVRLPFAEMSSPVKLYQSARGYRPSAQNRERPLLAADNLEHQRRGMPEGARGAHSE